MHNSPIEQNIKSAQLRSTLPASNCHTGSNDWSDCRRCILNTSRRRVAIRRTGSYGKGGPKILFIGEVPGTTENSTGEPYTGRAGRILDQIFKYADVSFEYWLTNLVGCQTVDVVNEERLNQDRPPTKIEIELCSDHIREIVNSWKPSGIVYLGQLPASHPPGKPIPSCILVSTTIIMKKEYRVIPMRQQATILRTFINHFQSHS